MINGLYPKPTYVFKAFGSLEGLNLSLPEGVSAYSILTGLSFYGALVSVCFVAVTFSYNRTYTKIAMMAFAPLILIGLLIVFMKGQYVSPLIWPDILYVKGAGLREGQVQFLISSFDLQNSASVFLHRFLTLGSVGAYGVYLIGLPALVMFIRTLFKSGRDIVKPILGLLALILLVALDILIVASVWTMFLSFALMVFIAILWGYTIRYK